MIQIFKENLMKVWKDKTLWRIKGLVFLIIAAIVLTFDLVTKYQMEASPTYTAHNGLFEINYVQNHGVAFGNMNGSSLTYFVQSLTSIATLAIALCVKEKKYWIPLMIISVGGIGNLSNRIDLGYVTDMIGFSFWPKFPTFNVADIFIVCSSFILVISLIIDVFKAESTLDKKVKNESKEV